MDVAGNGIVESILIDSDGELVSIAYRSVNAHSNWMNRSDLETRIFES